MLSLEGRYDAVGAAREAVLASFAVLNELIRIRSAARVADSEWWRSYCVACEDAAEGAVKAAESGALAFVGANVAHELDERREELVRLIADAKALRTEATQ